MIRKRFNFASNLTNKIFYIIAAIVIIAAIGINVYALTTGLVLPINPGHNSSQVFIPIGSNQYITLQSAVDYGYFAGVDPSGIPKIPFIPVTTPYEFANQVLITAYGKNMTLQQAIDTSVFINKAPKAGYQYANTVPAGGEYASNINVSVSGIIKNFQASINDGSLLSVIPTGTTCYIGSSLCSTAGTWQGGTCIGSNYLPRGTNCNSAQTAACDGSGHCQGWYGNGATSYPNSCQQCPFGSNYADGQRGNWNCYLTDSNGLKYQGRSEPTGYWYPWTTTATFVFCGASAYCNCGLYSCSICYSGYQWQIKPV